MDGDTEHLVRLAQAGDADAFAELIRRYERVTLAIAFATLGCPESAVDAVQEAFIRAWQRLGGLNEPKGFGPWLVGIVRNLSIDHRRKRRPATMLEDNRASPRRGPAALLGEKEQRQRLDAAIAQLDELSRCAVVLRYYDNLGSREIGQMLDLSPAAVDVRLFRARQQLRELLADDDDPQPVMNHVREG